MILRCLRKEFLSTARGHCTGTARGALGARTGMFSVMLLQKSSRATSSSRASARTVFHEPCPRSESAESTWRCRPQAFHFSGRLTREHFSLATPLVQTPRAHPRASSTLHFPSALSCLPAQRHDRIGVKGKMAQVAFAPKEVCSLNLSDRYRAAAQNEGCQLKIHMIGFRV